MSTVRTKFGLTSLELIIVILIVAILTAVAVPSFITFLQNHRLMMTADNLFVAMQHARSEAIKRSATIYVTFQTGDNWCYGFSTTSGCSCSVAGSCNLYSATAPASQQISFSTSGLTGNTFQIEGSRGAANVSGATVTMTLYGQTSYMALQIGQLGDFQLCSNYLSGYIAC